MEDLAGLLFALASEDRLTLFSAITVERLRLTELARKLSASTQETSRHLSRLQEAKLIKKESDGCFVPTELGRDLAGILPSLKLLNHHGEYFLSHNLSGLPLEFLERIGELERGELGQGVGLILNHTARVLREAKRDVWLASDNVMDLNTIGGGEVGEDVRIRIVVSARAIAGVPPPSGRLEKRIELKLADSVPAGLALNEMLAGVTLPDLTGKIDFNAGLVGSDPKFRKWCDDLFTFY